MLAKKFDPDSPFCGAARDSRGRPFINRNGETFATVLKFLRNQGSLSNPHELSVEDLTKLNYEAEYFCLGSLKSFIDAELKDRRDAEEHQSGKPEQEAYNERRKRVRAKFGLWNKGDSETTNRRGHWRKEYVSVICDVEENLGQEINEYTTNTAADMQGFEVHSVVPILNNGSTVKLYAVLVRSAWLEIDGPTPDEWAIINGPRGGVSAACYNCCVSNNYGISTEIAILKNYITSCYIWHFCAPVQYYSMTVQ